jgi:murein DD-endopeptidase MepM/ murein hydrolase activator NlpD
VSYPLRWNSIRTEHLRYPKKGGKFGPNVRGTRAHYGWDLVAPVGTPVYAVGPGRILLVAPHVGKYGTIIQLEFLRRSTSFYALYAHLRRPFYARGDRVKEGQLIGLTGISGHDGREPPHLHFEIASSADLKKGRHNHLDPATVLGAFLRDKDAGDASVTESSYPIYLTPEQIERAEQTRRSA